MYFLTFITIKRFVVATIYKKHYSLYIISPFVFTDFRSGFCEYMFNILKIIIILEMTALCSTDTNKKITK